MDKVGLAKADVFGYSMGAAVVLQLAIRHPEKVSKLAAASVAYDADGWQPAFTEFIPHITVGMFLDLPFVHDYLKLSPHPPVFPPLFPSLFPPLLVLFPF